eukprot:4917569-Pleurochrysis_carterae.AAC.1
MELPMREMVSMSASVRAAVSRPSYPWRFRRCCRLCGAEQVAAARRASRCRCARRARVVLS